MSLIRRTLLTKPLLTPSYRRTLTTTPLHLASESYGGSSSPATNHPEAESTPSKSTSDAEHPGPPPPDVGKGTGGGPTKKGDGGHGGGSEAGAGAGGKSGGGKGGESGGKPAIHSERVEGGESAEARKHNEELGQRSAGQGGKGRAEGDGVGKGFWKGELRFCSFVSFLFFRLVWRGWGVEGLLEDLHGVGLTVVLGSGGRDADP